MCVYQVFQRLFAPYLIAGYYRPSFIVMSSLPSSVAANTTATSASDPLVRFQHLSFFAKQEAVEPVWVEA